MGWKGTLRSLGAASRKIERQRQAQNRQAERSIKSIAREVDKISQECDKDLDKARKAEKKFFESPVRFGQVKYTAKEKIWTFKTISDATGKIKWSLTPKFCSDNLEINGKKIQNNKKSLEVLDALVCQYGIIIAVHVKESEHRKAAKKLYSSTKPEEAKIALVVDNFIAHRPIESNLDSTLINPNGELLFVAFALPISDKSQFEIHWVHLEEKQITCFTLTDPNSTIRSCSFHHSMTEKLEEQFKQETNKLIGIANEEIKLIKQANNGCLVMLAGIVLTVGLLCMFTLSR